MVGERSDESWKKVVGFPPLAAIISLAIADCEALQETSVAGHMIQTPPNVHLHATDPPTVRPPLIIYTLPTSLENVHAQGADSAEQQTP